MTGESLEKSRRIEGLRYYKTPIIHIIAPLASIPSTKVIIRLPRTAAATSFSALLIGELGSIRLLGYCLSYASSQMLSLAQNIKYSEYTTMIAIINPIIVDTVP